MSLALLGTSVFQGYWNILALIAAALSLGLIAVINFSDVWLGLLGASFFGAFFFRRPSGSTASFAVRSIAPWLLCAAIAVGMYFFGNTVQTLLPANLQITQVEVRPSWLGTFSIGQKVFAEPTQIFFGSGPNTFSREWGIHKPLSVNETQFWNADFYYGVGFIPTSFVTTGIFGFVAWGAVCLALLWGLYRLFRSADRSRVRIALMGGALFLTAFHILYVPGPALSLVTFLLFGALVAEELAEGEIREWTVSLSWDAWIGRIQAGGLIVVGLLVTLGSAQMARAVVSDALVNRAVVEYERTQDPAKATRSITQALRVLSNNDRAHRAGVELGILELSRLASSGDVSEEARAELQETLTNTIEHGLRAVSIENKNYQNWLTLARLYGELAGVGVQGAEQSARDVYGEAQRVSPTSPLPHLGLAQLDLIKGDDVSARKSLEAALALKPNLAAAHFLISQVFARAGDLAKAEEHGSAVVQLAPQDALGWYNLGTIFYAGESYTNAAVAFEQAVTIQNSYANALFLLGLSYYRLDREDDALRALKAVATLNPDDAGLADLIENIETGKSLGPSF
jgi:tetratricopeptide (TPR) repeat protein